ncbi:ABC transporter ATP-binding protein [Flavobacterium akiainvivens]|uniref:ABC transporter ATP-binding protein n=1 Tax=Flavobacterium akiainvivens TaxID=1202724 RepID=A0A0M9VHY8_9FLAO|nr:ABC transporter ATP-binding protein [Flavobacterium akiainvivens]KOS06062.1 ABC transporter ATP-binding protein [Flavobacterium akiainvivens]SFQ54679.1 ABC-type Fe3+/spermidine/putrescine transport systems, ATPase components [Flavobacterium akiainvivens]
MLAVKNISFGYTENTILHNISFNAKTGRNIAVIGESGCGKSTLLKVIYGLYDVNAGEITFKGEPVTGPKHNLIPGMPYMKYLAQDFDLMPYTTAAENVGAYLSNFYPEEKRKRTMELLEIVEMQQFADVKAQYLSGGQQQRIALAKVLALEPEVLLLDEPFSHIDNFRKNALRRNLFAYLKAKGITVIVATHDSTDALSFADETIVLRGGKIIDMAASKDIYYNPADKYTASLFGEVNEIKLELLTLTQNPEEKVLIYPHQLIVAEGGPLRVVVKQCYFKGNRYLVKAALDKQVIFFESQKKLPVNLEVSLAVDRNAFG